jgi:hypothetical protein
MKAKKTDVMQTIKGTTRLHYCLFVLLLYIFSCESNNSAERISTKPEQATDSVIKEIPKDEKGRYIFLFQECQDIATKMKLESLENGFDSLRIRLWFFAGMNSNTEVLDFRVAAGKTIGEILTWSDKYRTQENKHLIDTSRRTAIPISGWSKYIYDISNLGIQTLPDVSSIPELANGGGDRYLICVEIAKNKYYRFYHYYDPESNPNGISQVTNFERIVKLTEDQFDFKRVR